MIKLEFRARTAWLKGHCLSTTPTLTSYSKGKSIIASKRKDNSIWLFTIKTPIHRGFDGSEVPFGMPKRKILSHGFGCRQQPPTVGSVQVLTKWIEAFFRVGKLDDVGMQAEQAWLLWGVWVWKGQTFWNWFLNLAFCLLFRCLMLQFPWHWLRKNERKLTFHEQIDGKK